MIPLLARYWSQTDLLLDGTMRRIQDTGRYNNCSNNGKVAVVILEGQQF